MKIRPLNQGHRNKALHILENHPEAYGKLERKKDINHLLACQMWEVLDMQGNFVGMFGLNRFDIYNFDFGGWCEDIVLCNVFVMPKYRKCGIFKEMVEFAKKEARQDRADLCRHIWLTINAEPKNKVAIEIYNHLFTSMGYNSKQRLYWWEIEC